MTTLQFADTHNLVAFLTKSAESEGFEQIVDFLNASSIKYALTVNPTIYTSCIEQFWSTVKAKTVNGEVQLQALVDGKKIVVTEASVRRDLQLEDAEGVDCLPNATIFEQLTLMGSKTTTWNEFSSTMASTIICLATNQKFNFSKYIFESMVKNLENMSGKFLMYPSWFINAWVRILCSEDEGFGFEGGCIQNRERIVDIDANEGSFTWSMFRSDRRYEQAPTPTISLQQPSQVKVQDKGKDKMVEPEHVKKVSKKDLLRLDEELAFKLQAEEEEEEERLAREKAQ
ncbi:hypothetical protein Tco_1299609 [Tanacetum coccineum]